MERILEGLNNEQKLAATSTEGYVRVVAGAGTGKTKALTHRYAYIVSELGISPSNILCLTFTNKAAAEMRRRIKRMLGDAFDTTFVITIHSFCARILREDISKVFYPESFIVLDNADQKAILEEVYDEFELKLDTASFQTMIEKISAYKGDLKYMEYFANPESDIQKIPPKDKDEKIFLRYMEKQRKSYALDFSDLLNFSIYIFDKFPEILEKWQKRMHYIQVDEFQDVTVKEYTFIKRLAGVNKNLFVVGDPDQNIYEWRGSKMSILLNFDKDLSPCKTVIMSENYRSTPEILAAANSLIDKNKIRIKKNLYTYLPSSEKPEFHHAKSENDEAKFVAGVITRHVASGGRYSDCAVMYRSNYVSRFIENGLLNANIPYVIYGGVGFYERTEIKDILSYMRLVSFGDDISLLRVINVPRRKIGKTKTEYLKKLAAYESATLYETLRKHVSDKIFAGSGAAKFAETIEHLKELSKRMSVSELLQRTLIETDYEYYMRENGDMDRLDNVSELMRSIVSAESEYGEHLPLEEYLRSVTLYKERSDAEEDKKDKVRLMTVHTAKGLEFDIVFLSGMSDGIFPSSRSLESRLAESLEEERRLAFVAVTRAKRRLFITDSEGYGAKGFNKLTSRFVFDIEKGLLNETGFPAVNYMAGRPDAQPAKELTPDSELMAVGTAVVHRVFGDGVIEGRDDASRTYTALFSEYGTKPISYDYKGLTHLKST